MDKQVHKSICSVVDLSDALKLALAMLVVLLASCATTPQPNGQLEQARAEVQEFSQNPEAESAAPEQLRAAHDDLQRAQAAFDNRASPEEVSYLAYLAQRQAEIGTARIAEAHAQQQLAQGNVRRQHILLEARTREAQEARAQAANATAQAQNATQQAQEAQMELQKERQQLADLNARQTARGLELTLASDLLFDTGGASLKPGAELALNRLSDFLNANPQARIIVEGYTDSQGSEAYNQELSERRAQAVAASLEAKGVSNDRIQVVGRGKNFPVATNSTSAGRQQNRRVDIVLSDMSGRFAQQAAQGPALE
jgi:outer membrane protein OmpA-like peptidoglycan-associated protein